VVARPAAALRRRAQRLAVDAHPGYTTTAGFSRWEPWTVVLHHHAHASALVAEQRRRGDRHRFAWTAWLRADGSLWAARPSSAAPVTGSGAPAMRSFRPARRGQGRRLAVAQRRGAVLGGGVSARCRCPTHRAHGWERGLNAPRSSAAGRVFDALAAIVLGVTETSFEGQGPMWLEAGARTVGRFPELPVAPDAGGVLRIDWAPLLETCRDSRIDPAEARAAHAPGDAICRVAETERRSREWRWPASRGVFQNRRLLELAPAASRPRLPGAAAGTGSLQRRRISYGQVAEYLGSLAAVGH